MTHQQALDQAARISAAVPAITTGVFVLNGFTDSYAVSYFYYESATFNGSPTRVEQRGQLTSVDSCDKLIKQFAARA